MNARELMNFDLHQDGRGVMTAILNVPHAPVNVFNPSVLADLAGLLAMVETNPTSRALVFRSGKESGFLAGADVHRIENLQSEEEARQACWIGQSLFAKLEALPIPTLAVIQGPCFGGGLEFALACKLRLVVSRSADETRSPGSRTRRLAGLGRHTALAAAAWLDAGFADGSRRQKLGAKQAVKVGLADRMAEPADLDAALQEMLTDLLSGWKPSGPARTWPSWFLDHTPVGRWLVFREARRNIASKSAALSGAAGDSGCRLDRDCAAPSDKGFATERRWFGQLALSSTSRHLVQLFFQREKARSAATWVSPGSEKPAADRQGRSHWGRRDGGRNRSTGAPRKGSPWR